MKWEGREESKNVEDRRGQIQAGNAPLMTGMKGLGFLLLKRGGRRGLFILIIIFLGLYYFGVDPVRFLFGDGAIETKPSAQQSTQVEQSSPKTLSKRDQFIRVVLHETEQAWGQIFNQYGARYKEPTLVQFTGSVRSACGLANSAVGPFYCPQDQKLYLDEQFFDQLQQQFKVKGEFAQAYVIAHEVGHHVQNLQGTLAEMNAKMQRSSKAAANAISVRIELQADCYAGIWAHYTGQKGLLETGDIESALDAAHKIGDDSLQKQAQGYVVPDSFTHGTSKQRAKWFQLGYKKGDIKACDTFSNDI